MSHWNYRFTVQNIDGEEVWNVREFYYTGDKTGWSEKPDYAQGETRDELIADLEHMLEAAKRPAFDLDREAEVGAYCKLPACGCDGRAHAL